MCAIIEMKLRNLHKKQGERDEKISFVLVIALLFSSLGTSFASNVVRNSDTDTKGIVIQVEPGSERYTIVYTYDAKGHYITKTEAGFYFYTNTAFWAMFGFALKPLVALPFSFSTGAYYIPQENDYVRNYTAVTYDATLNRFDWTLHTTAKRNGLLVENSYQTQHYECGSSGYAGLMQKFGYLIPTSHLQR